MATYDPMGTTRRSRGCCYCCCGTKKRVVSCLLCTAVFLAGLVLILYFCIPREPTFCIAVGYPDDFSASSSGFNISIPVNVSVDNPNYYGFSVGDTTVNLVYKTQNSASSTQDSTLSTVNTPDIRIKARGNSTTNFVVTMESNARTAQADGQIFVDCNTKQQTTLYINLAVTILKRIHITVPDQAINVNCSTVTAVSAVGALPGASTARLASGGNNSTSSVYCKKANW